MLYRKWILIQQGIDQTKKKEYDDISINFDKKEQLERTFYPANRKTPW